MNKKENFDNLPFPEENSVRYEERIWMEEYALVSQDNPFCIDSRIFVITYRHFSSFKRKALGTITTAVKVWPEVWAIALNTKRCGMRCMSCARRVASAYIQTPSLLLNFIASIKCNPSIVSASVEWSAHKRGSAIFLLYWFYIAWIT